MRKAILLLFSVLFIFISFGQKYQDDINKLKIIKLPLVVDSLKLSKLEQANASSLNLYDSISGISMNTEFCTHKYIDVGKYDLGDCWLIIIGHYSLCYNEIKHIDFEKVIISKSNHSLMTRNTLSLFQQYNSCHYKIIESVITEDLDEYYLRKENNCGQIMITPMKMEGKIFDCMDISMSNISIYSISNREKVSEYDAMMSQIQQRKILDTGLVMDISFFKRIDSILPFIDSNIFISEFRPSIGIYRSQSTINHKRYLLANLGEDSSYIHFLVIYEHFMEPPIEKYYEVDYCQLSKNNIKLRSKSTAMSTFEVFFDEETNETREIIIKGEIVINGNQCYLTSKKYGFKKQYFDRTK